MPNAAPSFTSAAGNGNFPYRILEDGRCISARWRFPGSIGTVIFTGK
jgi:hypothetical protein